MIDTPGRHQPSPRSHQTHTPDKGLNVCDPEGRPRTIILWRETDLVNGKVIRRVHVTLDATTVTETILTQRDAVAVAEAILAAAR